MDYSQRAFQVVVAALFVLVGAMTGYAQDADPAPVIFLDGSPLIASHAPVNRGGEWFVPLLPVLRGVGASTKWISPSVLAVARQNGLEYSFNIETGEIRSRLTRIGQVTNSALVKFTALTEDVLFPISALVPLLGLSVSEDADGKTLRLNLDRGELGSINTIRGRVPNLLQLDYSYAIAASGNQWGQAGAFGGQGLIGNTKVSGDLDWTGAPGSSSMSLNRGSIRAELNSRTFLNLGDQGIYSGIDALAGSVRGAGFQTTTRWGSRFLFAGRQSDGTSLGAGLTRRPHFNTSIAGGGLRIVSGNKQFSFSGNYFDGAARKGALAGGAFSTLSPRNLFRAQLLGGYFKGFASDESASQKAILERLADFDAGDLPLQRAARKRVNGDAIGISIDDTLSPFSRLSITVQSTHYGKNFLTPREDSRFSSGTSNSVSFSLQPLHFWSTNGSAARGRYSYGTQVSIGPRQLMLVSYLKTVASEVLPESGKLRIDALSWTLPHAGRLSAAAYWSTADIDNLVVRTVSSEATVAMHYGEVRLHDQLQLGKSQRYGAEWRTNFKAREGFVRIGVDRLNSSENRSTMATHVGFRIPLLGGHSLELSYAADSGNHTLQLGMSGPVIQRKAMERNGEGELTLLVNGALKGVAYFDRNNNGVYDSTDTPLSGIDIWVDGSRAAGTDSEGSYVFRALLPGAHRFRTDLGTIPADFALAADSEEKTIAIVPNVTHIRNIRVLLMGRIEGRVTYMDYSDDPDYPIERGLPDCRIVVGPFRDAYSEANGFFIAGDLPKGEYDLRIDPASIPEGYSVEPSSVAVAVDAGQTVANVNFRVLIRRSFREKTILDPD